MLLLLFTSSMFLQTPLLLSSEVDTVKQKFQDKFDGIVEAEKIRFLEHYNLSLADLSNQELVSEFKTRYDDHCKKELEDYESSAPSNPQELAIIQKVADQVFKESNLDSVKVIHNNEWEDIGVFQRYETRDCYIILNCTRHFNNVERLADLIRHECSHIVYQDNFQQQLMQHLVWLHSGYTYKETQERIHPFCRASEMRADVYALLNSSDHGSSLIEFLKQHSSNDDILTYPKPCERIAVLEEIRDDLCLFSLEGVYEFFYLNNFYLNKKNELLLLEVQNVHIATEAGESITQAALREIEIFS